MSFFIRDDLISQNHSCFKPGGSCINQLFAIAHEIYKSFDACLDVRTVFLDISKAFDKVGHQGLLYKLNQNGISGNLLETLTDFLKDRKQRVVWNGQNLSRKNIEAGVPQGSILGPLLFLIYINDLPDNLSTNVKLFADDTSLFSVVHDIATSSCDLNYDLNRVREWAFQWKMGFNPEPSKQAQEVIFTRKLQKKDYPPLYFNDSSVKETCTQKHLGMLLDFRLDFQEHWKSLLKKVNKTVALLRKFQNILPRSTLLTIYKCFVRTHLDYGDIIYDQAFNNSFHQKIESLQYNAALAITGAIRGTLRKKKLSRTRFGVPFFKIYKNQCPKHLSDIIPQSNCQYRTRNAQNIHHINMKHHFLKNSCFPSPWLNGTNLILLAFTIRKRLTSLNKKSFRS